VIKILVIEPEIPTLEQVIYVLEPRGFTVQGAANGVVGIKIARAFAPDLILCDSTLPDIDGYTVLEQLRNDTTLTDVPFVVLSSKSDRQSIRRGMNFGADDYLPKPFSDEELLQTVKARLARRMTITNTVQTTLNLLRKNITYSLPHELRTPLQQILGFSSLLQDQPDYSKQEIQDIGARIFRSADRLHHLVENYLIYAQLDILSANPEQVQALRNHILPNPAEIIRHVASDKAEKYKRPHDLSLQLTNNAIAISKENFEKVLDELIDNAFKFSNANTQVEIQAGRQGHSYQILIMDHGRGMNTDALQNIGAYMQFERAVYEQQGVGLGLIIAKKLVEMHKGNFVIQSTPSDGTAIIVRFPM